MLSTDLSNIEKLYEWFESNQDKLKNIQPKKIAKELKISEDEVDATLSELVKEGRATRYFEFQCPNEFCDEEIIVDYENFDERKECELCSKTFIPKNSDEFLKEMFYEVNIEISKGEHQELDVKNKYFNKVASPVLKVVPALKKEDEKHLDSHKESTDTTKLNNNSVFIVHGRDNEAKTEVARYIENFGLQAIILHEQVSGGKTIIEKIEEFSDVGFAIILYTPCDVGALYTERSNLQARARQNVVFEHGYLIGKIGRKNVCALVKGDVEKPNDITGVVYLPMDESCGWKINLAKEMKSRGYEIDMNKL